MMFTNFSWILCQHYDTPSSVAGSPAAAGRLDLGPSVLATCVLEKETLRVFYDNGDDYPIPLQFPVKRCYSVYWELLHFRPRKPFCVLVFKS